MRYTSSIKLNKDFRRLYYRGKFKANPVLVTYTMKTKRTDCRIGITVRKKIGKAVVRNRVRRIIKAAFYQIESEYDLTGREFVFVARAGAVGKKSTDIYRIMKKQIGDLTGLSRELKK